MSKLRLSYLLWSVPPILVAGFLVAVRLLPREHKIEAYRFFFTEMFWLAVPYGLLALICAVAAIRIRRWWHATGAAFAMVLAMSALYARFVEPDQIVIRESSMLVGAPLRVALIADLHIGLFQGSERMQQIVDALNTLNVDVVVVAGDWTYEPTRPLMELLAPISGSRHRVLSVPGNHDEEMPGPPLAAELRTALIVHHVDPIEGRVVSVRGVRFVGIGDRWARKDMPPPVEGIDAPLVALAHNPDSVDRLANTPIRVMLAGHTHGGQVNLPIVTAWILKTATKGGFKRGLYQIDDRQVFVSSGLGMIGLPLRLFQPPVIDVITFQ